MEIENKGRPKKKETSAKKTIAVLTSGGDAPGMNAAVRAVVRAALVKRDGENEGMKVLGVRRGYRGLVNVAVQKLVRDTAKKMGYNDIPKLKKGDVKEELTKAGIAELQARLKGAKGKKLEEKTVKELVEDAVKKLFAPEEQKDDIREMDEYGVSNIHQRGGTILYTARCDEFENEAIVKLVAEYCKKEKIHGIVVIGGDGSFRGARDLCDAGIKCVGIPGTIDNDIACSDYTIGFDTALNTATRMVDQIRDTAQAHNRCSVVVVMGRNCGDLALLTGISCGAGAILIPEAPSFDFKRDIGDRIKAAQKLGKQHFIIVAAEGVFAEGKPGKADGLLRQAKINTPGALARRVKDKAKVTVLGYVQRGGSPTVRDRVIASQMGYRAVELLKADCGNLVVVLKDGKITEIDITKGLKLKKTLDKDMYKMARDISI